MKKVLAAVKAVLVDVARLNNPTLAAAIAAAVVAVVSPFGLNVGPNGDVVVGVLIGVGGIAEVGSKLLYSPLAPPSTPVPKPPAK